MAITINMGLVKWTVLNDPYDHTQLAGNFDTIDKHDHTTGKGVQIPTEGISSEAITKAKLAKGAVNGEKIVDYSISSTKLEKGIRASLGDFKWWWRPSESLGLPTDGWVVADGRTLVASEHDFPGGGTIILPNLLERFIQGVELEDIGTSGGSSVYNFAHSHVVAPHEHSVNPHTHFLNLQSGFNATLNLQIKQNLEGNAYVHSGAAMGEEHRHSINGLADETGLTTNPTSPATSSSLSSGTTIVPPHIGMLPMIKVKN